MTDFYLPTSSSMVDRLRLRVQMALIGMLSSVEACTAPIVRVLVANRVIISNITVADITGLTFPIAANETWTGFAILDLGSALGTTGVKLAMTVPSGATMSLSVAQSPDAIVATGSFTKRTGTSGGVLDFTTANMGVGALISSALCLIYVANGATAGTVALQAAQSTSSATALVIVAGSKMNVQRV